MKYYLLGDSHATDMAGLMGQDIAAKQHNFFKSEFEKVEWATLLGYALQGYIGNSYNRNMPEDKRESVDLILKNLEDGCNIILSYTDADSRIGMCDVGGETIFEDYKKALNKIFSLTRANHIFLIDWYGITNTPASEQICSPEQRKTNRALQVDALVKLENEMSITVDTTLGDKRYEEEDGFVKPGLLKDGVHFNLSTPEYSILFNRFKEYVGYS